MPMHELLAEQVLADETILSASEKQLLSSLVQHCKDASRLDDVIAGAIAQAVGEVVSSRANKIVGERIVERLSGRRPIVGLGTPPVPSPEPGPRPPGPNPPGPGISDQPNRAWMGSTPPVPSPEPGPRPPGPNPPGPGISDQPNRAWMGSTPPVPSPEPGPRPPGPNPPGPGISDEPNRAWMGSTPPVPSPEPGPRPAGPNPPGPGISDQPNRAWMGSTPPVPSPEPGPRPPGPNPPGPGISDQPETTNGISLVESICGFSQTTLTANYVLFDEFLAPAELLPLADFVLQHEREFQVSEVVSPGVRGGVIQTETRRSKVLMDLGRHRELIVSKLMAALPAALRRLGHPQFVISRVEAQITASNHGDFFHWHSDNGLDEIAGREITFVYFFHREPKPFTGGELRIYDSRWEQNHYVPAGGYRAIVPEQNQLVVFHSSLTHEITQVQSPSQLFADSRFTVNGWFHK